MGIPEIGIDTEEMLQEVGQGDDQEEKEMQQEADREQKEMQQELPRQSMSIFKVDGEFKNNEQIDQTKEHASEMKTKKELIKQSVPGKGIVIKERLETSGAKLDTTGNDVCDPVPASNDKGKKPMEPKLKNNSELAKDLGIADTKKGAIDTAAPHEQTSGVKHLLVFWDIQNCHVPKGVKPQMVKDNVLMSLRQLPLTIGNLLLFAAYGDFNLIPTIGEGLHHTGIRLIEVPIGEKDAADTAIIWDLLDFVCSKLPPAIVLLISGDVDFALPLNKIVGFGHLVIVAVPSGVNVSSYLRQAGRYVFDWPSMARGEGNLQTKDVGLAEFPLTGNIKTEALDTVATHEQTPEVPIAVFWDVHCCQVPEDIHPRMVKDNVLMYLRQLPFAWSLLKFAAYGDYNLFPTITEGLHYTGVELVHVPSGKKNTATSTILNAILCDVIEFARERPSPACVMLISGDKRFASPLHRLSDRGYSVIIAVPSGVSVYLCQAGKYVCDWPTVAYGG